MQQHVVLYVYDLNTSFEICMEWSLLTYSSCICEGGSICPVFCVEGRVPMLINNVHT